MQLTTFFSPSTMLLFLLSYYQNRAYMKTVKDMVKKIRGINIKPAYISNPFKCNAQRTIFN